jgi:signal transduction histidine kinase
VTLWQSACPPRRMRELWCQQLQSLSELTRLRARLRASLTGRETVTDPEREQWSERLVLVADELTSNALRHGRAPVATALSRVDDLWMVTVSDASTDVPPQPAQGRDPGLGGFGLYLIADLSEWHGWFLERGSKTVWAVLRGDPAPA